MDKAKKDGVSAKYNQCPKTGFPIFTNYSSSDSLFESKGYTPVQIICKLEFNDDWSSCLFSLTAEYLEPQTAVTVKKKSNEDYFTCRTFSQIIEAGAKEPDRKKIFGSFMYEDTNTYLFSRTNYGKSLLVFIIAYCAATGQSFADCKAFLNETHPMKVLVADLEMDAKTLYDRHLKAIEGTNPELLNNLMYLHENSSTKPAFGFDLLDKIETAAKKHKAKLIILDNISKILPDLLKAEDVAKTIEYLKRIRQNTGCSFLVIGHTTKGDPRTAIAPTSYYGSAALQNFFPEICYLDRTTDDNFYLTHAKTKRAECYMDNVPVMTRGKSSRWGVGFEYETLRPLTDVQLPISINTRPQRKVNLSEFKTDLQTMVAAGIRQSRIAQICNSSKSNITKILNTP